MKRLNQDELLVWLKCKFCNEETPCDGCIRLKQGCQEKQAYQQIREVIEKPGVTEEWIEEKTTKIYNLLYYKAFSRKQLKGSIRSLVEEIRDK